MNFCPNCATSIEPNQSYCQECNFDLTEVIWEETQEIANIQDNSENLAVAGLIIGIIGWLLPIPFIDLILCFVGIVLSWQGINSSKSGIAGLGVVVGIFGAIASIVFWF